MKVPPFCIEAGGSPTHERPFGGRSGLVTLAARKIMIEDHPVAFWRAL
jgi:hypothetical protein